MGQQNYLLSNTYVFCDLLLKSAFERIFNAMQLILVKYLIQKFHDISLSYYFKRGSIHMKLFMTGQEKGDLLIQVTSWTVSNVKKYKQIKG